MKRSVKSIIRNVLLIGVLTFISVAKADTIAVLLALEADLKSLTAAGTSVGQPTAIGTRKVQRLQIGNHRVFAALMGSGCVETAVTAEGLLTRHRCDLALSLGPAGGLVEEAKAGTWWRVSGSLVQGKNAGDGSTGKPHLTSELPSTWALPELLRKAKPALLSSGETFINTTGQRQSLASSGASLVDMNTHGLHAACINHDVPLHIWRVVSDNADEQAGETFKTFVKTYDGAGGSALAQLIKDLPANPKAAGSYPGIRKLLEGREKPGDDRVKDAAKPEPAAKP